MFLILKECNYLLLFFNSFMFLYKRDNIPKKSITAMIIIAKLHFEDITPFSFSTPINKINKYGNAIAPTASNLTLTFSFIYSLYDSLVHKIHKFSYFSFLDKSCPKLAKEFKASIYGKAIYELLKQYPLPSKTKFELIS